jgi:cyclomaltodextrinase
MRYISIFIILFAFESCSAQINPNSSFIPNWAKDAIYYQIFPERFANGDTTNDPSPVEKWDALPTQNNYFGGDLKGIIDHLDYLKNLGINTLYLNPIFESNTNHKYHTIDYFKIDKHFGDENIFKKLVDECHKRNIRIIIDGVFNHTGIEFFAFKDIVKNKDKSKYLKWYNIHSFPIQLPPNKPNYEAWWGIGELPKLMTDNPEVRNYLFDVTKYWMSFGIDGWRLDVPNEMSHDFWIEWRKLVKQENSNALIIGEIWDDAAPWLRGDQFDAVMNYRFRGACVGFIALENRNAYQFDSILAAVRNEYPPIVNYALQNLIGSHDTERFLTLCNNDTAKLKLAVLIQMTYLGAPMIYYGDEIGMTGGKDPDCRRTMKWDTTKWNMSLQNWYHKLIRIRKENVVFRLGDVKFVLVDTVKNMIAFLRKYENTRALIILNNGNTDSEISVREIDKEIKDWKDLLNERTIHSETKITMPRKSGLVLIGEI